MMFNNFLPHVRTVVLGLFVGIVLIFSSLESRAELQGSPQPIEMVNQDGTALVNLKSLKIKMDVPFDLYESTCKRTFSGSRWANKLGSQCTDTKVGTVTVLRIEGERSIVVKSQSDLVIKMGHWIDVR